MSTTGSLFDSISYDEFQQMVNPGKGLLDDQQKSPPVEEQLQGIVTGSTNLPHAAAVLGFYDMTDKDYEELGAAVRRVFDLMRDREWHTATAIIEASGQREGLRRARELRQAGYSLEKRRVESDRREFEYRLIWPINKDDE